MYKMAKWSVTYGTCVLSPPHPSAHPLTPDLSPACMHTLVYLSLTPPPLGSNRHPHNQLSILKRTGRITERIFLPSPLLT